MNLKKNNLPFAIERIINDARNNKYFKNTTAT